MTIALTATACFLVYCVGIGVYADGKHGVRDGLLAFTVTAIPAWIVGALIA